MTADIQFVYMERHGSIFRVSSGLISHIAEGKPWPLPKAKVRIWWRQGNEHFGYEWIEELGEWVEYVEQYG